MRGIQLIERGWLSSNTILLEGADAVAVVDSGYHTHSAQTLELIAQCLGPGREPDFLWNTHLHSDHCGGNHALQQKYPGMRTGIPPGLRTAVEHWDTNALTYLPTGQQCERFHFDSCLLPGQELDLGGVAWQVHAAPGHDPHSVILFEPQSRALISADALWERGFGVVFPELDGLSAFSEVAQTLDVIESLRPVRVLPGHGAAFADVDAALSRARARLEGFVQNPEKHARHAGKVLLKFKLLELQSVRLVDILQWVAETPYFRRICHLAAPAADSQEWAEDLLQDLVRSGAASLTGELLINA